MGKRKKKNWKDGEISYLDKQNRSEGIWRDWMNDICWVINLFNVGKIWRENTFLPSFPFPSPLNKQELHFFYISSLSFPSLHSPSFLFSLNPNIVLSTSHPSEDTLSLYPIVLFMCEFRNFSNRAFTRWNRLIEFFVSTNLVHDLWKLCEIDMKAV